MKLTLSDGTSIESRPQNIVGLALPYTDLHVWNP